MPAEEIGHLRAARALLRWVDKMPPTSPRAVLRVQPAPPAEQPVVPERPSTDEQAREVEPALNPTLRRLLDHCGFDRSFVRGEGVWLTDSAGRRYLDCYSQYGAVALGHNAEVVRDAVHAALAEAQPAMVQPYRAPYAEALARRLAALSGLPRCVFTTSGAEAVEAAIKLVRARTGRPIILSTEGSFHGKTMGALAATGQRQYALAGPTPPGFERVPFGDVAALEARFTRDGAHIAAFLVEPIQGEAGVRLPPPGYLAAARALCTEHGAALVVDEIQTGLGRTGRLFACEHEGVRPDVLLLAKSLGGGLFPLGACLVAAAFWDEGFALRHSSTFANNNVACRVGLAVVDEVAHLCEAARTRGAVLEERLRALAARYPSVVREVRGRGLLAAIELLPLDGAAGALLSYFDLQGLLAYAFAATLAERSGVLVLPSMGQGRVLRIAPPLTISEPELELALDAIGDTLALFARRDTAAIARAIGAVRSVHLEDASERVTLPAPAPLPRAPHTYAFIIHYTSLDDVTTMDPGLARLSPEELRCYTAFAAAMPPGVVLRPAPIRSPTGATAEGWIIAVPMLPDQMLRAGRRRVSDLVARAVDLAGALGAGIVGLGGYTTAYTQRGRSVTGRGPAITTGNTLTAAMSFEALRQAAAWQGRTPRESRIGVVGARGSVGALCARLAAKERPERLVLVGNPTSATTRLDELAASICWRGGDVQVTTSSAMLAECDLVISATGAVHPALTGVALRPGTVVCDVARPHDAPLALRARRDLTVIDGGLVTLPDPSMRFGVGNLQGYPDGVQLACLSETIVLALAGATEDHGVGDDISLAEAEAMLALAGHHGFQLAAPSRDGAVLQRRRA